MKNAGFFKQHPAAANAVLFLTTAFVLLAGAEIYFRHEGRYATFNEKYGLPYHSLFATDQKSWYFVYEPHRVTGQTLKEYAYSIKANNEGLLDKDFTIAKKPHTIRIMVIGDSFVQGMGAVTDSTLPKQLEGILQKQYPNGPDIEVLNCGIANSDPVFEYKLFTGRLLKYQPDYVIEVVNFTDVTDVLLRGGFRRFNADSSISFNPAPWYEPVYAKSYLFRRVYHDLLGYNWLFLRPEQEKEARNKSMGVIDSVLTCFQNTCAENKISFLAAFHPSNYEMSKKDEYSIRNVIQYCDSMHIHNVDVKACLVNEGFLGDSSKSLYWPIDGHCNRFGYMHFAQCISAPVMQYLDSVSVKETALK